MLTYYLWGAKMSDGSWHSLKGQFDHYGDCLENSIMDPGVPVDAIDWDT